MRFRRRAAHILWDLVSFVYMCPHSLHGAVLCPVAQSCPTLCPHGLQPARLLCPRGFSRKEHWDGLSCPLPGDLSNPGIKPRSPTLQVDSVPSEPSCMHARSLQSCPTLCDPMDCSLPDSSVHGILQARIAEWVASSFSRGTSQARNRTRVSCTAGRFFTT